MTIPQRFGLTIVLALLSLAGFSLSARETTEPLSRRAKVRALATLPQYLAAPIDQARELESDARVGVRIPLRFASAALVQISPATHGNWETVPGGRLWRLRVQSTGATDLNLGFTRFRLTPGSTLHLYCENEDYVQGAFTAADNQGHGQLWTPALPGDRLVVEMFVPDGAETPELLLTHINRGYRDMFQRRKTGGAKAGACENDVICPIGDPWRNEIRSVGRYTYNSGGSGFFCSGQLVNTANNDLNKHYFLTAAHCVSTGSEAASVVVYWNYESPVCGQHGGGSLAQSQSGTTLRMTKEDVDVTLLELNAKPNVNSHVYYSGWDRSGTAPGGAVGIHHPAGDEKSISFSSTALTTVDNCIGTGGLSQNTHWQVFWNSGVTEGGSSGSGIWDPVTHLLVGTLSGGDSDCGHPNSPDCYGKFSVAWASGASAATRLRDWLDPLNSGVTSVAGRDSNPTIDIFSQGVTLTNETCLPANQVIDPGETVSLRLELRNVGTAASTNLSATLLPGDGVSNPGPAQTYGVIQPNGVSVSRTFTFTATGSCGGLIFPSFQVSEGNSNLITFTYESTLGRPNSLLTQNFDTVTAPALPAGWSNTFSGSTVGWVTTTALASSGPNSAFAAELADTSDARLTSPALIIQSSNALLTFTHSYDTELGSEPVFEPFDGGALEISVDNSAFTDWLAAGGTFLTNGYNAVISPRYTNPLAGRDAWAGNSGGYITTTAAFPPVAVGHTVRLRWRFGTDESFSGNGWSVDTVLVSEGYSCCGGAFAPTIGQLRRTNNNLIFSFATGSGGQYVTEFRPSLVTNGVWTPLQTNLGDGGTKSVTNPVTAGTNRFFRVRVQ